MVLRSYAICILKLKEGGREIMCYWSTWVTSIFSKAALLYKRFSTVLTTTETLWSSIHISFKDDSLDILSVNGEETIIITPQTQHHMCHKLHNMKIFQIKHEETTQPNACLLLGSTFHPNIDFWFRIIRNLKSMGKVKKLDMGGHRVHFYRINVIEIK